MKGITLTAKQRRFTQEYLVDGNATAAAKRAGYSKRTAAAIGLENLEKPLIKAELERAIAKQAARTEISADRVLKEYAKIAFADAQNYHDADGHVKPVTDLSKDDSAAIQHFESSADGATKIKLYDKLKSLDSLAKHLGLLQPDSDEAPEVTPIQFFMKDLDGTITEMGDKQLKQGEQTLGIAYEVVDARRD